MRRQPPGRTDKNPVLAYGKNARLRAGGKVRPNYRSQADLRQFGINYFSFKLKIQKALETVRRVQGTLLTIASDHGQQLVRDSEIFYIEVQGHNLIYHTLHGDLTATGTLKQIEAQLKPSGFYRCNYCYLVNLRHVGFLDGSEVTVGQYKLQISRNRRKEFLQQLTQFYGRGGR
ncbi:MAG: LytTR family transcriptional regulator [Subdoligranulum sp.]|nr:LytTR family transcriptional regulator [Subdoligranulum sp.]